MDEIDINRTDIEGRGKGDGNDAQLDDFRLPIDESQIWKI